VALKGPTQDTLQKIGVGYVALVLLMLWPCLHLSPSVWPILVLSWQLEVFYILVSLTSLE